MPAAPRQDRQAAALRGFGPSLRAAALHISGGAASLDAKVGAEEKRAVRCYLCGPAGMIEGSAALVLALGLDDNLLNYEQWW